MFAFLLATSLAFAQDAAPFDGSNPWQLDASAAPSQPDDADDSDSGEAVTYGEAHSAGYWQGVDQRAHSTHGAGLALDLGGLLIGVAGELSDSEPAYIGGGLCNTLGHLMVMGSSLRSTTALNHLGGHVSPVAGYISWVMYGSGELISEVGASNDDQNEVLFGGLLAIGSYLPIVFADGANQRARADLGLTSRATTDAPNRRRVDAGLSPSMVGGHPGLVLAGAF